MGVVASAHGRIEVDPDVLINAGKRVESLGTQLAALCDSLGTALAGGIASGADTAGLSFALGYGRQAQDFANTLATGANSFKAVGYMLQATGYNYKNADAGSTIGGHGPAGSLGPEPSQTVAGDMPAGPNGVMVPPPPMWYLVEPLLQALPGLGLIAGAAMAWPSGHAAMMNVVAAQWRNFATGFVIFQSELNALKPAVSAQNIPEGAKIGEAFDALGEAMSTMTTTASDLAQHITDFAQEVQQVQNAIRRLLDRLSLSGLWDTVTDFFTGDGMKVLREVARDVGTVLGNFQRQVKGIVGLLDELKNVISDAADAFEKWIRPVLVAQFGDGVGNFLADAVTLYTDFEVGIANGLINTVSGVVSMADPDMWKGLAETAWAVANDPSKAPGVLAEMGKQFIALDQWQGDHPGRGAGGAAFNIGSLFVPGGALSKTGSVAKGLNMTRRVLEEGRLPKLGEIGQWSRGAPNIESLGNLPGGQGLPDVPEVRPGAIPDSLVGPSAPHGIDAPTTPRGIEGPSGPPDPPGPQSSPGPTHQQAGSGDGPPPEPPGRSVPPSDPGPGRVDGPPPQSPGSPHAPEPTTPPHAPESPSPTGTHDAPSHPGPATPPHAPEPSLHAPEPDSRPAVGDGHVPGGHDAPASSHTPAEHQPPVERPGSHDQPTAHAPTSHEPAAHQPTTHETVDSTAPHAPTEHDAGQHSAPPAPVVGGMPMAPHAIHSPSDTPSRTPTPDAPARGPETRAPQSNAAEPPRTQPPSGAGPSTERSPQAPVKPDTAAPSARPGNDPPTPRMGDGAPTSPTHETAPTEADEPTRIENLHEDQRNEDGPHESSPGSSWDGPEGREAAERLPTDDSGYRIQPRDCKFLDISPEQVEAWASREAPLGMTPPEFTEFSNSLFEALAREGLAPEDFDLRLQGSSARFFSGEHKWLPTESELADKPEAQARADAWFGDDHHRPLRRPFDSMYRLGLDAEPSDYDVQISSDSMVEACKRHWEASGSEESLMSKKYGFVKKVTFEELFPHLWDWADLWTERTGRPVVPALFPSSGPPDTSWSNVSSHFRDTDWRIEPTGGAPK